MPSAHRRLLFAAGVTAMLSAPAGACVTSAAKTGEMSKESHLKEAGKESAAAKEERKQYNPSATTLHGGGRIVPELERNPTQASLDRATEHDRHAAAHLSAAQALQSFEDRNCVGVPAPARGTCPLLTAVKRVELMADGVRLVVREDADLADTMHRVQCHLAYSRAAHISALAECSLYLPGVTAQQVSEPKSIELRAEDPAVLNMLQARAAARIPQATATSPAAAE